MIQKLLPSYTVISVVDLQQSATAGLHLLYCAPVLSLARFGCLPSTKLHLHHLSTGKMDETQELPMNLPAMNPTTLESLPVELRIQILKSILDFLALHRLLNASPVYRRTYGFVQGEVIFSILYHHYGCVAVDVLATVLSAKFDNIHIQRTKENVIAFLDRYRHARGAISPNTLFAHSTVEEQTLRIEGFHNIQKCLTSLVDEYLENFDSCCLSYDLGIPHDDNGRCKHSLEERMRITRGICRVQTSVNVFARLMPNSPAKWGDFEAYEIFGATFPQWEQHEIWSMFKWIDEKTWALVVIMDAQHTVLRRMYITCLLPPL